MLKRIKSVPSFLISLALFGLVWPFAAKTADRIHQAQLEAAFIYQFTNYIKWPGDLGADDKRPFVISIVGSEVELFQELNRMAKMKTVRSRPIEVHRVEVADRLQKSEIVMIMSSDVEVLQDVIRKVKDDHTLILSQADGFAKRGSMINFFLEEERLRFEINLNALKKENLQISSQVLNLAKMIND